MSEDIIQFNSMGDIFEWDENIEPEGPDEPDDEDEPELEIINLEYNQTCDMCYELFPNDVLEPIEQGGGGVLMYCEKCYSSARKQFDQAIEDKFTDEVADAAMKLLDGSNEESK